MTDQPSFATPEPPPSLEPVVPARRAAATGEPASANGLVPASRAAVAGIVAAGAALATGELLAGLIRGIPSPLSAVGTAVIDFAPPGSKELVVSLFGTNDKPALLALITIVVLLAGAGIGLVGRRRFAAAGGLVVALVGVGALAALRDPLALGPLVVVAAALQVGVGLQALLMLLTAARIPASARSAAEMGNATAVGGATTSANAADARAAASRRTFLVQAGAIGAVAALAGIAGRTMLAGRAAAQATATTGGAGATGPKISFPPATDPAPALTPDASFNVPGLTPVVVPNDGFYRIDTAFFPPTVDVSTWSLRVFGKVDKEVKLTFDQLLQFPLIERYVTIACVSNEVGGRLVGNAKWTGVKLSDVLAEAGVHPDATQIVPRSVDGWTAGFPTAWLDDPAHPRDALIAVKMNDAPLPVEHGFPARLIVPGLYGYVSATKWLSELELTTLEAFDAYWVPRGWAKEAPILTQSRIDTPLSGSHVSPGTVAVAGVAWAPDRGISKVEVRVDGKDWQQATLATELSAATWVQWKWAWQAEPGTHFIEVRATDGTGEVQTDKVTPPDPDGARGHHQVQVQVS